ncbi:hypothetical protein FNW02_19045 [Komarekiella sp. 'clone 1']|uniref:Uncharacterized protein n=1 Tax=Komarekiella delphini-convector SJRDD-AB1 TaxID=2593771 RepID=A0AA40VSW8_9NOST|nr:hypothetical protein [Komarekiella delphini-convector]MBD6617866.1 hypothetical protein [Komarekiella delphini-convector SJRDD-AB1]
MSKGHKGEAQGFAPLGSDTDHRRTPALRLLSAYRTFRCASVLESSVRRKPAHPAGSKLQTFRCVRQIHILNQQRLFFDVNDKKRYRQKL